MFYYSYVITYNALIAHFVRTCQNFFHIKLLNYKFAKIILTKVTSDIIIKYDFSLER